MTLARYLELAERIDSLPTRRAVDLFVQNELQPLTDETADHRVRDLMYTASTRRNFLTQ